MTEKGERQARNAGRALKRLGVQIDACITSPKVRARETARIREVQRAAFAPAPPEGESFEAAVARVIATLAQVLRAEAPVLSPFMRIGSDDPVVAEEGR